MCGIAGILGPAWHGEDRQEQLLCMAAVLAHRGPDGAGIYLDDLVGLAHTRLGIIDLEGGAQPLTNEDGTLWVSFNGEIFNHIELRRELIDAGHRFATRCDTEVIVHAFEEWGHDAWRRFNGQFAISLWDSVKGELHLVRDQFGILPLFLAQTGDRIAFGSEAKALFASGIVHPELEPSALAQVFTLWSVPAPGTVFKGITCVPPGTAITFDTGLRSREFRYWQPNWCESDSARSLTLDDAASELQHHLSRAVALRLRADVPVGAYLSGGLDSSVITQMVRTIDRSPLETFGIGFTDARFDETAHQRIMVDELGTRHHHMNCSETDVIAGLSDVVWHAETPLLRTAPAPLFSLSGLVQETGMKVVLTGEGADELLAGYGIFKEDKVRRFWARSPESEARASLLSRVYPYVAADGARGGIWQAFFGQQLTETEQPFYSHNIRWRNTAWSLRFLAPNVRDCVDIDAALTGVEAGLPENWGDWKPLARAQAIECATFLTPYLLPSQGDRVAMAHGIEVRYPFLDPDVIEFCTSLPSRLKLSGLRDKNVLRRMASRELPEAIWNRPKQPYRAPMATGLVGDDVPDAVNELLSERALSGNPFIDGERAALLVAKARRNAGKMGGEREEMALIGLLTLQLLQCQLVEQFDERAASLRNRFREREPVLCHDFRRKKPAHAVNQASAGGSRR